MNKHECIARAKTLVAAGDENSLRYAALELRTCMELITYEKLRDYSSMIPETVLEKWQPPQAVKALLEFEPLADQSYRLSFGRQSAPGVPAETMTVLGEHKSLNHKWLRTHYNKIGNALHAHAKPSTTLKGANRREYLEEVIADLEPVVASRMRGTSIRSVFTCRCERCDDPVVVNVKTAERTGKAVCFKPGCKAEYNLKIAEDKRTCKFLLIQATFTCIKCEASIFLPPHELAEDRSFTCGTCNTLHTIVGKEWVYEAKVESKENSPDSKVQSNETM
jgi:hypothetical protein